MIIFGWLLMLGAIAGVLDLLFGRRNRRLFQPAEEVTGADVLPTDSAAVRGNTKKALGVVRAGQTVTLSGEGDRERAVLAAIDFRELYQPSPNAPWTTTGAVSKAVLLAGEVWIFKVPSREAGKPTWFKAREVLLETPLMAFYKGTDAAPGPARTFKNQEQSGTVVYELPDGLTEGVAWRIADIGAFLVSIDGECDACARGDRLYFVTSREEGGGKWLLYLDARKGEAKGSGGLFVGEPFEPSVEIRDLL